MTTKRQRAARPTPANALLARARLGDSEAFAQLVAPHRRELEVHCYRLLGSRHDAEDALQDTLVAAWKGLSSFEERASLRTWLYRVATNRCLDVKRRLRRRAPATWDIPGVALLEPSRHEEVVWLEPYPDRRLDEIADMQLGPDAQYDLLESVSLAFVTALQLLPPRQLAVVVLRDVLGFPAREVADLLDATIESVTSALKRGRATLQRNLEADSGERDVPTAPSATDEALMARFVDAWEAADPDAVVALLTDDAFMTMPPMPYRYDGATLIHQFCTRLFDGGRRFRLLPTRANGQPALGAYLVGPDGSDEVVGLYVLTVRAGRIVGLTRFERSVLDGFDLPQRFEDRACRTLPLTAKSARTQRSVPRR